MLSVSTRNRLYEIIATLVTKKQQLDTTLGWIAAIVREESLFHELTPHTKRDLNNALQGLKEDASQRGFLANLLIKKFIKLL